MIYYKILATCSTGFIAHNTIERDKIIAEIKSNGYNVVYITEFVPSDSAIKSNLKLKSQVKDYHFRIDNNIGLIELI